MKKIIFTLASVLSIFANADDLQGKLDKFMPLSKDLSVISKSGDISFEAVFRRPSPANTPDFRKVENDEPRFFNSGLLIEPGGKSDERGARNFLPPGVPLFDTSEAKASEVKGRWLNKALAFSGTAKLNPARVKTRQPYIFSVYAKGKGKLELTPVYCLETDEKIELKPLDFNLEDEYKRINFRFAKPPSPNENTPVKALELLLKAENATIEAPMLEGPCVYFQSLSPSTYIEPGAFRAADMLSVSIPEKISSKGAFSFEFTPYAEGGWHPILSIGGWWTPDLELSLYGNRVSLNFRNKKVNITEKLVLGKKYHCIVNYSNDSFFLWINGKKIAEEKAEATAFKSNRVYLGCREIETKANGIFSNFAIFETALTDTETAALFKQPDLTTILPRKSMVKTSAFSVFPINIDTACMRFRTEKPVSEIKSSVNGIDFGRIEKSGENITCFFTPGMLIPGKYRLDLNAVFKGGGKETSSYEFEIAPALRPWNNYQVSAWNEFKPEFIDSGFTIAYSGLEQKSIDDLARNGLYGNYNLHYFGTPRPGNKEDVALDSFGNVLYPDVRSEHIKKDIADYADRLAATIKDAPTFKSIVINTEQHAGGAGNNGAFDFSEKEIARAKAFGLDLEKWRLTENSKRNYMQPLGYLATTPALELVPENRIINEKNPLLSYLLDRHGPNGGTEVAINDLIARRILSARPDTLMMQDPLLRRPMLNSYREINVAQDWFYYPDLLTIVHGSERLNARIRNNHGMTYSVMPQFLFKAGMAAPYAGMPPSDMFREACFLAASRPGRVISFWNAGNAFIKGNQQTPKEIRTILGDRNWKETLEHIQKNKLEIFAFDPNLKTEFKSVSEKLWLPLGALLPEWKNAPRKLALVESFTSNIFGNVRWPGSYLSPLEMAVIKSGMPFDVLLDSDLENGIKDYDIVILPSISALTEKAVNELNIYSGNGGILVADENLKVKGLRNVRILHAQASADTNELNRREREIFAKFNGRTDSPPYIEAMQQISLEISQSGKIPELDDILKTSLKQTFSTESRNIYWNHLQANGTDYLFIVNDLRIPGPMYGQYGIVKEQGLPQKVMFNVNNANYKYAFDLLNRKKTAVIDGRIGIELPPCGGAILMFAHDDTGDMKLTADKSVLCGKKCTARISLSKSIGLIPVRLDLYMPDGGKSSLSHCSVLCDGKLEWSFIIPLNAPAGEWKITAEELASGKKESITFNVNTGRQ